MKETNVIDCLDHVHTEEFNYIFQTKIKPFCIDLVQLKFKTKTKESMHYEAYKLAEAKTTEQLIGDIINESPNYNIIPNGGDGGADYECGLQTKSNDYNGNDKNYLKIEDVEFNLLKNRPYVTGFALGKTKFDKSASPQNFMNEDWWNQLSSYDLMCAKIYGALTRQDFLEREFSKQFTGNSKQFHCVEADKLQNLLVTYNRIKNSIPDMTSCFATLQEIVGKLKITNDDFYKSRYDLLNDLKQELEMAKFSFSNISKDNVDKKEVEEMLKTLKDKLVG